jgi:hypothetical protein
MSFSGFHFFADANSQAANPVNYIHAQSTGAYGPVIPAAGTSDDYRVTSLHTATFDPTAYAPCNAILCVQRVDALRVNIVLKPLVQPALNFAPVKYIVYKGVLASSLISGTDVAPAANNDLTAMLHAIQAKKNISAGTTATAPAEALGIGLAATAGADFADTAPIDNLFYRTGVAFQLPVVKGGATIGQFDKAGFGIEILMEGLGFHHALKTARQIETLISVPSLQGGETAGQLFDHWHAKEQILGYMDPCAFYGSMFAAGVLARTSTATEFAEKKGAGLYQDVLFPFANRNTAYLDIRNEHNFSFNYFRNYGTTIRLSTKTAPVDYYAGGWPILTLTAADLTAGNTTKARNAFGLQLPVGDNPKPLVFVSQGYRAINQKGTAFPPELKNAERFFDAFGNPTAGYTTSKGASGVNSLTLAVPNVTGLGAATPVSCYIRLKYLKQEQGTTTVATVVQAANYLDNLIWPLDLNILLDSPGPILSSIFPESVYLNALAEPGLQFDAVADLGIARDSANTSFLVIPTDVRQCARKGTQLVVLSSEASDFPGYYPNFIALKYPAERVLKGSLALPGTVPVARFASDRPEERFAAPSFDKLCVIVVPNSTYAYWQSQVASGTVLDGRFRTYLGIRNLQTLTDTLGAKYTSFELVLRGFALDASGTDYEVREISADPAGGNAALTVYADAGP